MPANNTIYETPLKFAEWQRVAANLYPGTTGNTSLTDDTTPATTVYTGSGLSQPIYNIAENDGVISFSFIDPSLTGIVATETTIGEQPSTPSTADRGKHLETVSLQVCISSSRAKRVRKYL